ncbi:MAG: SCO family protein [Pseudomonadota bacterium]
MLIGLIFMAPAFVAWVMHYSTGEGWQPEGTTNRGILVHPARPLMFPDDLGFGSQSLNDYLQGKWTLVYIGDADCDAVCNENLYKMRQIRLAQNENMKRVQRLFLVSSNHATGGLAALLEQEYPDMAAVTVAATRLEQITADFVVDDTPVLEAERVYIIDPLRNLMMYYQPDADPGGMLKDLQKLLKYSKIG